MANNYGLCARKMAIAGIYAANIAVKQKLISFATAERLSTAWALFCEFAEEEHVKKMEFITADLVIDYGHELVMRVDEQDLAAGTAQNYVSAINSIMHFATKGRWGTISPTKDCHIPNRSFVRLDSPVALDRIRYAAALETVLADIGVRGAAIIQLCRELGLRSKEASLLNAKATLAEANATGTVTIFAGTKGGRDRDFPITTPYQIAALELATEVQGADRSMIPTELSWKQWREGGLRAIRESVQSGLSGDGLHDLRSSYACERYQVLTGFVAPVCDGVRPDRDADCSARLQIAEELGHGRIDITNAYLGGKKK